MAIHVIADTGSFRFFARSANDSGEKTRRKVEVIGWAVDDKTLQPQPIIFPALQENETLVYLNEDNYQELA
jgi:hypothetical protein